LFDRFPQVAFSWFVLDAITHLSIELGYVLLALGPTARASPSFMGFLWREYARADSRWAGRDPNIIAIELVTVFLLGPACLLAAWAIYHRRPYRHVLQLGISLLELYGGWMTFAPDVLAGAPSLALQDPFLLSVHLIFMNGLWVLIPAVLAWESGATLVGACSLAQIGASGGEEGGSKREERGQAPGIPSVHWFWVLAMAMVVYVILVPLILVATAAPPPVEASGRVVEL
jgi:hypothetical protein